ncbi:hypothetical protein [Psychroflexus sediminis]|nr:hypothetical protein [Psychroflexus sediminis]
MWYNRFYKAFMLLNEMVSGIINQNMRSSSNTVVESHSAIEVMSDKG